MKNSPISLLIVPDSTAEWMREEMRKMRERNGSNFGLTTLARSIMNAVCESGLSLDSCRGEHDVFDLVRKMISTAIATATEVK